MRIDIPREGLHPALCAEVGVKCADCIRSQVANIHAIIGAEPIPSRHAVHYFRDCYPSLACQPMERQFIRLASIKPILKTLDRTSIPVKPALLETIGAHA